MLRRLLRALGVALAVWFVGSAAVVGALRFVDPPVTSFMLQRVWQARAQARAGFSLQTRWVRLDELPPHVGLAVVCAEDQRFFKHRGFDVEAIKRAVGAHLQGDRLRGASTLTQQTAKNLFLWEGRGWSRKALEAYFTVLIEVIWPKRRILEVYLNIAELGDGVFGVGAAARHHFGRDATQLTRSQAALLAAVLPSPLRRDVQYPSPGVRRKQRWILQQMPVVRALQPQLWASR